ncbi:MAG: NADH:flavin oxidoreductase/NADH oxidase [bacterium]
MNSATPPLFSPLTIRGVTLRNRIMMSPMCQYSADDGIPNTWHLVHLGARATGGVGLVMTEATSVVPEGRISPGDVGLWNDEQLAAWRPIIDFIESRGAVPGIQLAHAGRKASTTIPFTGGVHPIPPGDGGWVPEGPSPIPFSERHTVPSEMTEARIAEVIEAFVAAAKRAVSAGFKVIELHMAHGYLLQSFLSPVSNRRTDRYGGDRAGRMTFALELAAAVRGIIPESMPLFTRISSVDWLEEGWQLEDSVVLIDKLQEAGVDLVDASSGGITPEAAKATVVDQQPKYAEYLKKHTNMLIGAVGGITRADQANLIIEGGTADIVVVGRQLLREPHWALLGASKLGVDISWPDQYLRAKPQS